MGQGLEVIKCGRVRVQGSGFRVQGLGGGGVHVAEHRTRLDGVVAVAVQVHGNRLDVRSPVHRAVALLHVATPVSTRISSVSTLISSVITSSCPSACQHDCQVQRCMAIASIVIRFTAQPPALPREALRGGISRSFLEQICGHVSPKIDKVSEELTLRHPHEGPCVAVQTRARVEVVQQARERVLY